MNTTYTITCHLEDPSDLPAIEQTIRQTSLWVSKIFPNGWLIFSEEQAFELLEKIRPSLKKKDKLVITELKSNWASFNLSSFHQN